MKNKVSRIIFLDNARGLAILLVVVYHLFYTYPMLKNHIEYKVIYQVLDFFSLGSIGVSLFFMISGYLMAFAIDKQTHETLFLMKRFNKIFPLYWYVIFITTILYNYIGYKNINLVQFIMNALMLQDIFYGSKHIDGVFWSILIEVKFYIMCYFFIKYNQYHLIYKYFLFFLFCSFVAIVLKNSFHLNLGFGIYLYFSLLLNGMLFYQYTKGQNRFFIIFQPLYLIYLFNISKYIYGKENYSYAWVISILLFLMIYRVEFKSQILSFFAVVSYPLYLIHQNFSYLILDYFINLSYIFSVLIAFICSVIFAVYLHKYIEFLKLRQIISTFKLRNV